ncbi:tRNA (adenine(58)-N(1))-methyltransferase non-catalytic subunit trm6 [Coemansia spiralis]|nr:tRNA (adenine(58)-N(1))-methyltransferase non-catalytic subunit trm6 [Coemansia spiralis]
MDAAHAGLAAIENGSYVIIRMPSSNAKIVCVKAGATIGLGKFGSFRADELIGAAFGHTYEIEKGGSIRPHRQAAFDDADITEANNREIVDDPSAQKLTFEEIEALKTRSLAGDVSAQDIISRLTENNEAFAKKTEFSKSKYIRRKEKKFMKSFVPLETTVYNVCNHFFEANPTKIRGIRTDTLAQVLGLANVYAAARVLAVDDGQGMLVSALLSRIAEAGTVFGIHDGDVHNYDLIRYMNFSAERRECLRTLPWAKLHLKMEPFTEVLPEIPSEQDVIGHGRRQRGHAKLSETVDMLNSGGFDALVISTNYNPTSVLKQLVPYLGSSRMLVVYDQYKETLVEAYAWLRESPEFLNVQLTESWLREYQVLPGRTHPTMTTSGGGGFVLSAIRLAPGA